MTLWKINFLRFLLVFENVSTQHSSLITIEKWKRALDENMKVGAIFMNLSKARDTLNHLGFFWLNLKHIVFNQLF